MAAPIITIQPRGIVSTLAPIFYQCTESTANTLNVVAQLQYDATGSGGWTDWGGKMRLASTLVASTTFQLDAGDVFNSLPKGQAEDMSRLGSGCCYGGGHSTLGQDFWFLKSNWHVRAIFQREYLDAATGFIELDPDETESNVVTIHEGLPPRIQSQRQSSLVVTSAWQFGAYYMQFDPLNGTEGNWLWLTDAIHNTRSDFGGYTTKKNYKVRIRPTEQFLISTFNGELASGITDENVLTIRTFDQTGSMLETREINWSQGNTNDGMQTMDVGFRTIICALEPIVTEGTDFENVTHYEVYNAVKSDTGAWKASTRWWFTIDRTCVEQNAYRRFLWKNQLGGWDMFSSEGTFESKRQTKHETFTKRLVAGGQAQPQLYHYGKNNWITIEDQVHKITTHALTDSEAMWFSKIVNSAFTYVRVDMEATLGGQIFGTWDSYETWRDGSDCNGWAMIVIKTNTMRIRRTSKKTQRITFEYSFARRDVYPRN